jgi:maleate isomerase
LETTVTTHHIGMIVPSSNLTMETELPRMLRDREAVEPDDEFVFHCSRMRMRHVTPDELRAMNAQTERAALEVADARPDVVATACLVAIMAQGSGYHCTAEDQIASVLAGQGVTAPVVSSAGALLDGLGALRARRIAMITPYVKELTRLVATYIEDSGVEVVDALSLEVSDNLAVARLPPADLRRHWRRLNLAGADALVLSACVQMPSLAAIQPVEDEAGLPVLSAATATAFTILTELGLAPIVPNAGSLLAGGQRLAERAGRIHQDPQPA